MNRLLERWLAPALLVAWTMAVSVHLGPDASWDLRNYHLYNAFALLHKAPGTDLAPAQLQSFLPPWPDVPAYALRRLLNRSIGPLDAILALPSAVAAIVAYGIGLRLLEGRRHRWLPALLAVFYGLTGASGLPTTGAAISEMPAASLVLGGLLTLLHALRAPPGRRVFLAACLMGVGAAVKLTMAPYILAACLGFVVAMPGGVAPRLAAVALLAAGGAVGGAAAGGGWWWHLWAETGNPIFPYFNNIFRSPLSPPIAWEDGRFWPHGALQAVFFPLFWGFQKTRMVSELVIRDPRIALAAIGLLAYAVRAAWTRRVERAGLCVAVFLLTGYVLWEVEFAIFRYLAAVELLSGMALLLAVRDGLGARRLPWLAGCAAAGLAVFLAAYTRYPDWDHAPGKRSLAVSVPAMPPGSMVLMLGDAPISYIAVFADRSTRFIGADTNFVQPGSSTGYARRVEAAVRAHPGALFGLIPLGAAPEHVAKVLAFYGLHVEGDCRPVASNLDASSTRLCTLARQQ